MWVSTATTPGAARAASVSIDVMRACACGERTNTACAWFVLRRVLDEAAEPLHQRVVLHARLEMMVVPGRLIHALSPQFGLPVIQRNQVTSMGSRLANGHAPNGFRGEFSECRKGRPYIGRALPRLEDARLSRGAGRYTDDVHLPGEAHAVFVRSPHAHAAIRGIDTAAARAMPGVLAVLTGADYRAAGLTGIRQMPVPADVIDYKQKAFGPDSAAAAVRHAAVAARDRARCAMSANRSRW